MVTFFYILYYQFVNFICNFYNKGAEDVINEFA